MTRGLLLRFAAGAAIRSTGLPVFLRRRDYASPAPEMDAEAVRWRVYLPDQYHDGKRASIAIDADG